MTVNSGNLPALLLGASGFLGPALCEAFGSSGAMATHFIIMPVFVSSDAVFDGSRAYWSEGLGRRKRILCAIDQYFTPAAVQSYFAARDGRK